MDEFAEPASLNIEIYSSRCLQNGPQIHSWSATTFTFILLASVGGLISGGHGVTHVESGMGLLSQLKIFIFLLSVH